MAEGVLFSQLRLSHSPEVDSSVDYGYGHEVLRGVRSIGAEEQKSISGFRSKSNQYVEFFEAGSQRRKGNESVANETRVPSQQD